MAIRVLTAHSREQRQTIQNCCTTTALLDNTTSCMPCWCFDEELNRLNLSLCLSDREVKFDGETTEGAMVPNRAPSDPHFIEFLMPPILGTAHSSMAHWPGFIRHSWSSRCAGSHSRRDGRLVQGMSRATQQSKISTMAAEHKLGGTDAMRCP